MDIQERNTRKEMERLAKKRQLLRGRMDSLGKQLEELDATMQDILTREGIDDMQAGPFRIGDCIRTLASSSMSNRE